MTDLLQMAILAIVQGLTEFLPISSSGHLILAKHILGFEALSGLGVELLLHAGTLVAVIAYYWRHIGDVLKGLCHNEADAKQFTIAVILSMIPAVLLGLTCEDALESLNDKPIVVCALLIYTGCLLLATKFFGKDEGKVVTPKRGFLIGLAQAVAMLPGVSRSGSTIAMSRFLGIASDKAAAFSFLMVVPVILGGNLLHVYKALQDTDNSAFAGLTWPMGILGFVLSAIVGYASVAWMVRLLGRHSFWKFGFYCLPVGVFGIIWFLIH